MCGIRYHQERGREAEGCAVLAIWPTYRLTVSFIVGDRWKTAAYITFVTPFFASIF